MDRLKEVGGLEITGKRERVAEEYAEEVAFRRHVVRGSHASLASLVRRLAMISQ
jgi:hypothetical protein